MIVAFFFTIFLTIEHIFYRKFFYFALIQSMKRKLHLFVLWIFNYFSSAYCYVTYCSCKWVWIIEITKIYIKKLLCHCEIIEHSCSENAKQDFDRISSRLFGTIFFQVFFYFSFKLLKSLQKKQNSWEILILANSICLQCTKVYNISSIFVVTV